MAKPHVAIWSLIDRNRLSRQALETLTSEAAAVFVSAVSVWEIAIKQALPERPDAPPFGGNDVINYFTEAGFKWLSVSPQHAAAVEHLPPHHADPFDRLLVAQALTEPMRLMTADRNVARYSDTVILI